ncbi:hypothetical protein SVAN01_11074 [Stagonosporopsis vannaccii]|nr:hypothetical protein SVAN01_11074 [Stagonosporopsis vannaccii]
MQDLPQELISAIITILQEQRWSRYDPSVRIAPLACINRNWKTAVERELWNHITIKAFVGGAPSEDVIIFQQYIDGPVRQSRRSMIRVLSLSWCYGDPEKYSGMTEAGTISESDDKVEAEASASPQDDPWSFPELISCEDEEGLEINAGSQPEPDLDQINALLSEDESDDEPVEDQGGHRSGSDTDDTDGDEEGSIRADRNHTRSTTDVDEGRTPTWDSINSMISSDESDAEEPLESDEVQDHLLQQLQCTQTSLFGFVAHLWRYLASCGDSLNTKRINLRLEGKSFDDKVYASLRHDEKRIVDFLQSTLETDIELPNLPSVEEIFVDGRRALVLWPALVAAVIATASDPPVSVMEYRAQAFGRHWKAEAVAGLELEGMRMCYVVTHPS